MKPSEILIAMKEKIATPEKWLQGGHAKNVEGEYVDPESKDAICWCSLGAAWAVTHSTPEDSYFTALEYVRKFTDKDLLFWNDDPERTHEEVMNAFDKAIALAQKEGA